jgi:hypothetical protein
MTPEQIETIARRMLPLVYLFERKPEIERQEGLLLAGELAIAPSLLRLLRPSLNRSPFPLSRVCCGSCRPESWGRRPRDG